MKTLIENSRRSERSPSLSFARATSLSVALCALLLTGCTVGGPQGNGDLAGRQSKASLPADAATATVFDLAERTRADGDYSSAISLYRRAINLDPNFTKAFVGLGETLLAAGIPNEAIETFREAHNLWPNDPAILRGLGSALVAVNQPGPAIEVLNQAIKLDPSPRAYGALGVAQNLLGNADAADQAFRQGLVLAPDDLDLLNNFGLSLALRGDYDNAIRTLRRAAADPKAGVRHRLNLALVLGLAGRTEDAAQIARIDLDERAVHSNLVYYAQLRALTPEQRAAAILRPGAPLPHAVGQSCDVQPCPKPALADNAVKAPRDPVQAATLPSSEPAKAAAAAAPSDKGTAKSKDTTPKTDAVKTPAPATEPRAAAAPAETKPAAAMAKDAAPAPVAAAPAETDKAMPPPAWESPKPLTPAADEKPATKAEMPQPAATQEPSAAAAPTIEPAATPVIANESGQPEAAPQAQAAAAAGDTTASASPAALPAAPESKAASNGDAAATQVATNTPGPTTATSEPPASPVVKASAATAAASAGKHAAWIQIASFRSEQNAQNAWRNMANGNKDLGVDKLFSVRRVDLPEKGTFYVLRMGPFDTVDTAHDLCSALRERKIECFVAR